mmetsp:Transcript_18128/g.27191  ORF Transcript_18128/g.27191 Transcript_18128/m.27191 type:complete len:935 (+) Transcript_18128:189-2993(+)
MDSYSVASELDRGTFGIVRLVRRKIDGRVFVMKTMNLARASQKRARYYYNEVQLLSKLRHPNIVTYVDSFHAGDQICIVMEYYKDGNLGTFIDRQRERKEVMSEAVVLTIFTQILFGVYFLHRKDIIHRDLKPKNIFINDNVVVVGDLGISKALNSMNDFAKTFCGTPNYIAPELFLRQKYSKKVDVWSLGCILCEMLSLRQAFGEQTNIQELQKQILSGHFSQIPRSYSTDIQRLVRDLLRVSERERPTVEDILKRPFINKSLQQYVGGLSNNMTYLQVENARRLGGELGIKEFQTKDSTASGGVIASLASEKQADVKWGKFKPESSAMTSDSKTTPYGEEDPLLAAKRYILDETSDGAMEADSRSQRRRRRGDVWQSLLAASVASGVSLLFGFNIGFAQIALPPMAWGSSPVFKCDEWMSSYGNYLCIFSLKSWQCESISLLCACLASTFGTCLTNWLGRRRSIYYFAVLQLIAWVSLILYDQKSVVVGARACIGFTIGVFCIATPCYLSEISTESYRGRFVSIFPLQYTLGILCAILGGIFLQKWAIISFETNEANPPDFIHATQWEVDWRKLVFAGTIASAILLGIFGCVPESPRWLKSKGRVWVAVHELQRLGNVIDSIALRELGENTPNSPLNDATGVGCCFPLRSKDFFGLFMLGVASQLTLPFPSLLNVPSPIADAHPQLIANPEWVSFTIVCVLLVGILASIALIDVVGRRSLLLFSLSSMVVFAATASLFSTPIFDGSLFSIITREQVAAGCVLLYVFSHGLGLSTVPWVLASEITSQRMRAQSVAAVAGGILFTLAIAWQFDIFLRPPRFFGDGTPVAPENVSYAADIRHLITIPSTWRIQLALSVISMVTLFFASSHVEDFTGCELDARWRRVAAESKREATEPAGEPNIEEGSSPLDAYQMTQAKESDGLGNLPPKPMWRK